jgi:amino acid permease
MNNIIGTGLFALPALFQQTGWIPCVAFLLLCMVWTTQSSLFLARTMQSFAGNARFSKRLEFSDTSFYLLPRWAYLACALTVAAVFFSQNLTNILVTSQVMDATLLEIFGRAYALDLGTGKGLVVTDNAGGADSIFGDAYVLTAGYGVVLVTCIPLGILNLEDNIGIQVAGCILSIICIVVWVANFVAMGLHPEFVPLFGTDGSDYEGWLSTVLFNYGFVATIPSWLNEKRPSVSATSVIC